MNKTDSVIRHTRSAPVRNSTRSAHRIKLEEHMKANQHEAITSTQAGVVAGVPTWKANNILTNMKTDGQVRMVGKVNNRQTYVWKTSPIQSPEVERPDVVPPRQVSVMTGRYNGAELRPFDGRQGAMDAYRLPSRGMGV